MKQFFKTVLKAGDPNDKGHELTKLIQWKIDRTPFWSEDTSDTSSLDIEEESVNEESIHESSASLYTPHSSQRSSVMSNTSLPNGTN